MRAVVLYDDYGSSLDARTAALSQASNLEDVPHEISPSHGEPSDQRSN